MRVLSKKVIATLLLSTTFVCVAGCSRHSNDEAITKNIQSKLAADPLTSDAAVSVTSKDGKVTLRGAVRDAATQERLAQIVREEPGTTGLDNQTAVVPVPAPEQVASLPEPPPPPQPLAVPAGTALTVTVDQALGSKTSQTGQTFLATLAQPVTVNGMTAIPKGARVTGRVITAKKKGKIKGEGQLSLALTSITIHGQNYAIRTQALDSTVKGKGKRTAATTGGGAAGGALIGGLAGGGKGAGIGALVGATGGFVAGAFTGNKQIEIPAESALTFTLSRSLTLPPLAE